MACGAVEPTELADMVAEAVSSLPRSLPGEAERELSPGEVAAPGRGDFVVERRELGRRDLVARAAAATAALLADSFTTAEVFQHGRVIDRRDREPWLTGFETTRGLELLDLTGTWPTQAGASMAISTGRRPRARRWSRAIHGPYPEIDGLHHPSSTDANRAAVALYERAADVLSERPLVHRAPRRPGLPPPAEERRGGARLPAGVGGSRDVADPFAPSSAR